MQANSNISKYVAIAALAVVVIGSFLVWAKVTAGPFSAEVKGTDSGKDGTFTLILALIGIALIFFQERHKLLIWGGIIAAGLCAAIGIYDTLDISHLADETGAEVTVGIGLWLVNAGGIVAVIAGLMSRYGATAGPSDYGREPVI